MPRDLEKSVAEFTRLTEPCCKQLYGIALALCKEADEAHDLTQETLIRAFKAFDQFRPGAPMMPWLRQILRNAFLDTRKAGRVRYEVSEGKMGAADSLAQLAVADESADPLSLLERSQLSRWLQEEVAALEPAHQQVLMLCVMQDLSFEEAAEMAGIPVGTVASRLARARAQLRERMLRRAAATRRQEERATQAHSLDEKPPLARKSSRHVEDSGHPSRVPGGAGQGGDEERKTPP